MTVESANSGIAIKDLVVQRGGRTVIDGLSLSVAPGEVYALLGGNGAGKSTTLFAILGLTPRDGGQIDIANVDPAQNPNTVRERVAYLPETVALYEHLSAMENIRYFLNLAGQPRPRTEIEAALNDVRLDPSAWSRKLGSYSKGMRQKTAIALAILRSAPILLLDEPTSGLDPVASSDLNGLVTVLRQRGVAILMVTHDLFGAAAVADRIGLLDKGRIRQEWRAGTSSERFNVHELHSAFAGAGT